MKKIAFFLLLFGLCAGVTASAQKKPVLLNHIALYIYNLKTGTDFYRQIIGLDTMPEPFHDGRHTWFKVGEHSQLHLIQGAKSIVPHDKNSHLCFTVSSMEAMIATLQKAGIAYEDWPGKPASITTRPDGVKQIYFKDPDGYWVEINNDRY